MSLYQVTMSVGCLQDLGQLPPAIHPKATRAIQRLVENPWTPELQSEKVNQAEGGIHSSRVDRDYRVIWKHIKPNHIVLCLIDKHDPAYQRAVRRRFTLEDGVIKYAEVQETKTRSMANEPYKGAIWGGTPKPMGKLFLSYYDWELQAFGVPNDLLPRVRVLDNVNELELLERLLPVAVYNKLLEIALGEDKPNSKQPQQQSFLSSEIGLEPDQTIVPDSELRKSLEKNQGGDDLYLFISSEEFQKVLNGDIEGWLLFLAPHQRQLVSRSYAGPARLRGVAGSGKTVVAIHRVRHLAQQIGGDKTILFLTFGNRLPAVNQHLLTRLAGVSAPELRAIECVTVHKWCSDFMRANGYYPNVNNKLVEQALVSAINTGQHDFPRLAKLWRHPRNFFADEIKYSIKGRALTCLDEYLRLERSGRGTALVETERRAIWTVYEAYQEHLNQNNGWDFDDYIVGALQLLQNGAILRPYQAAVVDEVQDLTQATIRLIRAIVRPGPNDLFLVGDGLQRLFPGGFVLNQLGIDISGRSTILRQNYRNTQEILRAAFGMMGRARFNDLEDQEMPVEEPEYSLRRGPASLLRGFTTPEEELSWVAGEITRLKQTEYYKDGDFVILYRMRPPYKDLIEQHLQSRFNMVELSNDPHTYFGPTLKHTTFDSAKGLEFKVVFIVGVTDGQFVPRDDWSLEGSELEDYFQRERSRLFVAMTRARDRLYLSYSRGQPSRFLANIPTDYLVQTP
ncbi:MAG: ATP-dependent helicase [Anaerolineae bacterium]|nr:ATP-dependent helicase [Anaerolineae bacterium]